MASTITRQKAEAVAAALDVGLGVPICLACLSFVSSAIRGGDERDIQREVRRMTPDLWDKGLAAPALAAARRAAIGGVPGAREALRDLEARGGRSVVARAIVRRLGDALSRQERANFARWSAVQDAMPGGTQPELN